MAKILIVDDDSDIRDQLLILLSTSEHNILDAASGEAALELLKTNPIDLVVLDQMMPGMSGTDTARKLSKINIPFLFCSGVTELDALKTAMSLGALNYIIKPFNAADVALTIESALARITGEKDNSNVKLAITYLMGRFDLSHQVATRRLRKISRDSNIKKSDVARQINEAADLMNRK